MRFFITILASYTFVACGPEGGKNGLRELIFASATGDSAAAAKTEGRYHLTDHLETGKEMYLVYANETYFTGHYEKQLSELEALVFATEGNFEAKAYITALRQEGANAPNAEIPNPSFRELTERKFKELQDHYCQAGSDTGLMLISNHTAQEDTIIVCEPGSPAQSLSLKATAPEISQAIDSAKAKSTPLSMMPLASLSVLDAVKSYFDNAYATKYIASIEVMSHGSDGETPDKGSEAIIQLADLLDIEKVMSLHSEEPGLFVSALNNYAKALEQYAKERQKRKSGMLGGGGRAVLGGTNRSTLGGTNRSTLGGHGRPVLGGQGRGALGNSGRSVLSASNRKSLEILSPLFFAPTVITKIEFADLMAKTPASVQYNLLFMYGCHTSLLESKDLAPVFQVARLVVTTDDFIEMELLPNPADYESQHSQHSLRLADHLEFTNDQGLDVPPPL